MIMKQCQEWIQFCIEMMPAVNPDPNRSVLIYGMHMRIALIDALEVGDIHLFVCIVLGPALKNC